MAFAVAQRASESSHWSVCEVGADGIGSRVGHWCCETLRQAALPLPFLLSLVRVAWGSYASNYLAHAGAWLRRDYEAAAMFECFEGLASQRSSASVSICEEPRN